MSEDLCLKFLVNIFKYYKLIFFFRKKKMKEGNGFPPPTSRASLDLRKKVFLFEGNGPLLLKLGDPFGSSSRKAKRHVYKDAFCTQSQKCKILKNNVWMLRKVNRDPYFVEAKTFSRAGLSLKSSCNKNKKHNQNS